MKSFEINREKKKKQHKICIFHFKIIAIHSNLLATREKEKYMKIENLFFQGFSRLNGKFKN